MENEFFIERDVTRLKAFWTSSSFPWKQSRLIDSNLNSRDFVNVLGVDFKFLKCKLVVYKPLALFNQ